MKKEYILLIFFLFSFSLFRGSFGGSFIPANVFLSENQTEITLPVNHAPAIIDIRKLGTEINSISCEFPVYFSEKNTGLIYFVDYKSKNNSDVTRDFFFSKYDSVASAWINPINISKDYLKFCEENKVMSIKEIFVSIDNDIYSIDLKNKEFLLQKLNINTKYLESGPCLSPDGSTLYFVSDRKGGYGEKDIWISERLSNGTWSEPYNMGKEINTGEDEESPFLMRDGATFYFSSKGHHTCGGFDIFTSTQDSEGMWSVPESLGTPVNSVFDDFFYRTDSFGRRAFYSSDKLEKGNHDIFCVTYNSLGK